MTPEEFANNEYVCSLGEFGRTTNTCEKCGKIYKLPGAIFRPRDKICFTCEHEEERRKLLSDHLTKYKEDTLAKFVGWAKEYLSPKEYNRLFELMVNYQKDNR